MQAVFERARLVRLAIFDVDGVMTDGSLYLSDSGEESKAFHTRDGQGMKMLQDSGVALAILSGRRSRVVELRAAELQISHVIQGAADKLAAYLDLLRELGLETSCTSYMGDDLVDLPVLQRAGLAVTVPDSPPLLREHVHYVTKLSGGHGAVREFCELIMQAQGSLAARLQGYLA